MYGGSSVFFFLVVVGIMIDNGFTIRDIFKMFPKCLDVFIFRLFFFFFTSLFSSGGGAIFWGPLIIKAPQLTDPCNHHERARVVGKRPLSSSIRTQGALPGEDPHYVAGMWLGMA